MSSILRKTSIGENEYCEDDVENGNDENVIEFENELQTVGSDVNTVLLNLWVVKT